MTKQQLFETHQKILLQAAGRRGWRTMPQNGATAIQAGLVRESDPTWTYSDDHRASNGFALTDLGWEDHGRTKIRVRVRGLHPEAVRPHRDRPEILPKLPGRHPAVRGNRNPGWHQLQVSRQNDAGRILLRSRERNTRVNPPLPSQPTNPIPPAPPGAPPRSASSSTSRNRRGKRRIEP